MRRVLVVLGILFALVLWAQSGGIITTVAGNGTAAIRATAARRPAPRFSSADKGWLPTRRGICTSSRMGLLSGR